MNAMTNLDRLVAGGAHAHFGQIAAQQFGRLASRSLSVAQQQSQDQQLLEKARAEQQGHAPARVVVQTPCATSTDLHSRKDASLSAYG